MAFNAGDPTRSAPTGCNSVTQITQTVQSKATGWSEDNGMERVHLDVRLEVSEWLVNLVITYL